MFSPAIGTSGQRMHAPPTLISLTSPSNELWLVSTMADQSTGTLGNLRLSFCVISLHFLVICPHTENVDVGAFEKGDLYTKKRVGQALSSLGLNRAGNMPGD